jgi:hypothetical protein
MTESNEDLERFNNALSGALGGDIAPSLAAATGGKHDIGQAAVASYAVQLLAVFGVAFFAQLAEEVVKESAKKFAERLAARFGKGRVAPADRLGELAALDEALRAAAADPGLIPLLASAVRTGEERVAIELEALGLEPDEAREKAAGIVQVIVRRMGEHHDGSRA